MSASVRLGVGLCDTIQATVYELLARAMLATRIQLPEGFFTKVVLGSLDDPTCRALCHLLKHTSASVSMTNWDHNSVVVTPNGAYKVRIQLNRSALPVITNERQRRVELGWITRTMRPEEAAIFAAWLEESSSMYARILNARTVLKDLLDLAGTAGQLNRMAPELVKYLPAEPQAILRQQVKRSPLPAEWATYDRDKLKDAMDLLAMCHLMPRCVAVLNDIEAMPDNMRNGPKGFSGWNISSSFCPSPETYISVAVKEG